MYDNIYIIIALVLLICYFAYLYYTGKKKELKALIYSMVILAEKTFGDKTGEYKYDFVIGRIYPLIPAPLKLFITEKMLDNLIEEAVQKLKERLKDNPSLLV